MLKKWLPIFIVSFLVLILIVIKVYPESTESLKSQDNEEETQEDKELKKELEGAKKLKEQQEAAEDAGHKDELKPETFPFKLMSKKKYAEKHPDKFNIVNNMFYSWDFIESSHGAFKYGHPQENDLQHVEFSVDLDKKQSVIKHEKLNNGKVNKTFKKLYKGGKVIRESEQDDIYFTKTVKKKEWNGELLYGHYANVLSSEYYFIIYDNYSNWSYKEGNKFGIPVYEIEGTIPEEITESWGERFTMTVSKEHGVLLELKSYGQQDEPIFFITVEDIEINSSISDDVFNLNLSDEKEVSPDEFLMIAEGIDVDAKTGGIDTSGD